MPPIALMFQARWQTGAVGKSFFSRRPLLRYCLIGFNPLSVSFYDIFIFLCVLRFLAASRNAFSMAGVSSGESSSNTISFFAASLICLICSSVGFWFLSKVAVRIIINAPFCFCGNSRRYQAYILFSFRINDKQDIVNHSNCIITVFIHTMFNIIYLNALCIIENKHGCFEIYTMPFYIYLVFLFIPFKFQYISLTSSSKCNRLS